jgi:4-hydroxy-tetrahydrodipicolinate synthase
LTEVAKFRGVLVALLTPFDRQGRLDEPALRGHIDGLIEAGVHGLVPAGSTGEVMTLDPDEYRRVIEITVQHVAGRVSVVAGCSANATHQVVRNCLAAQDMGADGLMIIHPFYSHPTPDELYEHYATIAGVVSLPIVIYNNPSTTGVDAFPELFGRLAGLPHVEYVKETSGDTARITRILECSGDRLAVFSGKDDQALDHFACGASGWISGSANVIPAQCVALYDLAVGRGDFAAARILFRELQPFFNYTENSGHGVQAIKASTAVAGRPLGSPRAPLRSLPDAAFDEVRPLVERALRAALPASARVG